MSANAEKRSLRYARSMARDTASRCTRGSDSNPSLLVAKSRSAVTIADLLPSLRRSCRAAFLAASAFSSFVGGAGGRSSSGGGRSSSSRRSQPSDPADDRESIPHPAPPPSSNAPSRPTSLAAAPVVPTVLSLPSYPPCEPSS